MNRSTTSQAGRIVRVPWPLEDLTIRLIRRKIPGSGELFVASRKYAIDILLSLSM